MLESLRMFGILLRKSWLVRKRHWITSIIGEILLPTCLIVCGWLILRQDPNPPKFIKTDSTYEMQSLDQLVDEFVGFFRDIKIMYAPSNPFTDELLMIVDECLKNKINITGFVTEEELITTYLQAVKFDATSVSIVFNELTNWSTKNLRYKLRRDITESNELYAEKPSRSEISYHPQNWISFVPTQICLDMSFIRIKTNRTNNGMEMPYPEHIVLENNKIWDDRTQFYRIAYIILLVTAFQIPLLIEASMITNEKFVGINILMSMNGISNALNLFSWIVSGMILLSVLCTISTILIFTSDRGNGLTFMYFGNPVIVFFVLLFHVAHMITFATHIAAYFSKGLSATCGLIIMNILAIALRICALEGEYLYLVPYLGMTFPNVLLYQAMREISSIESLGVQWSNLFRNAHLPSRFENSIGMILILSMIGAILHFILAACVYAVKPGKYGVEKNPLMLILYNIKRKTSNGIGTSMDSRMGDKYFEPTSVGICTPGIQIRNLKKSYGISCFSNKKVEALRGISVDFYKGQITSLLGHNGAGKSTLMSILTGLTSSTDGNVLINSKNLEENASEVLKDMGLCTQENMYFSCLTVTEQLEFLASVKGKGKTKSVIREEVQLLVQKLKFFHVKDTLANGLSEDQKRKLCLGMAFVGDPSILVLDEPTSRLDQESKRVIWDMLLTMRGQKTILISTHDMEEADLLGDRIAIMQNGRLKSYGSSLYLKKMIAGQNNLKVTLSIEKWANPDVILSALHVDGKIIDKQDKSIILNIPNTPKSLEDLEILKQKKTNLGISGYSLSLISLEQVFLVVTEENHNPLEPYEITTSNEEKLTGSPLVVHGMLALWSKKISYTLKNSSTILIQFLTAFAASLILSFPLVTLNFHNEPLIPINPDAYDNAYILYASSNREWGNHFRRISQMKGGNPIEINNASLEDELSRLAKEDLIDYNSHLIAATQINETANGLVGHAFYSTRATFSLPISVNLFWNTVVANILGSDHSISVLSQDLENHSIQLYQIIKEQYLITNTIFAILFNFVIAMFAIHPSRESSRGIKHLQKMTGVSGFTYWGTMFVFDLIVIAIIVLMVICVLALVDYFIDSHIYQSNEIVIISLLLMLFGVNALPIAYIFSFMKTKTQTVVRLLTLIPMGIVIVNGIISVRVSTVDKNDNLRSIQSVNFFILPYVCLLEGIYMFSEIASNNAMCSRSTNDLYCRIFQIFDENFQWPMPYFGDNGISLNLKMIVIHLCLTPVIYFGILAALEAQLFRRIKMRFIKKDSIESSLEEQVQREKTMVFEKINALNKSKSNRSINIQTEDNSSNPIFLAYELRKHYRKVRAVEDVSFGINKGECFGLFGVNGSGKSVTLKMITDREILDHGVMFIEDKDFKANKKSFLSQMGYCPQRDATLKSLNSYDHLRLFARLRGIPKQLVEREVDVWIDRLNLGSCASLPCRTYSSGNKQRLNLAIALIGNPKLVLLDEPTVGVDPGARHSFWNTIKSCQQAGQTFLVASHNMDECEVLCKRTAVMLDGKLICMEAPKELKQRFGAGYDVQIRMDSRKSSNQVDKIKEDMRLSLHCVLTKENPGFLLYHVGAGTTWKKVYEEMNKIKNKYNCIDDFLVVVRLSS